MGLPGGATHSCGSNGGRRIDSSVLAEFQRLDGKIGGGTGRRDM